MEMFTGRFMLGVTMTMGNKAMELLQLIESLHLSRAWKARKSHGLLVGLPTV